MRRIVPVVLLLALAACQKSEAEVLEANYEASATKGIDAAQDCASEMAIADAWARQGNQEKYDERKFSADLVCLNAQVTRNIARHSRR